MRKLVLALVLTMLAVSARAQAITSYTAAIYPNSATTTAATTVNTLVYPTTAVTCAQPIGTPTTDPEVNPVFGFLLDPVTAGKGCTFNISGQLAGLTPGTVFKGALRANLANGTSTAYSAFSNSFLLQPAAHPCDATPTSKQATLVGQAFELGWCHDGKDTGGNVTTVTGWKVYRNGVAITATVTTDATPNASGLKYSHVSLTETVAGTAAYDYSALNAVGESAKGGALSITATPPASVPTAPTRGRIQ